MGQGEGKFLSSMKCTKRMHLFISRLSSIRVGQNFPILWICGLAARAVHAPLSRLGRCSLDDIYYFASALTPAVFGR